ncbi:hypothetical protein GGI25_000393 [Coemansia spiralis]|uniref:Uncharacterized protein n=2 Tax=Coemansia TaxID=4863 RepID=A0A9W8L138_9FUNG|nr:hypothetical protein BX070DRAFT_221471 [Coemansia spiralis]KAJ1996329.1 hypothetical protein EDC05_000219 [Coemansia umbellata]KAJ2624206.1 hypothetical protein GGI26_001782 [Coemansia sp. RSA 1358]KAJ2680758.1 hypothetical protein GGI25_000393 [Coemansia spiralis]
MMQTTSLAIAAAAIIGQTTATLDLLSGRPLSEAIFGLSPEQVKRVDDTVTRAEQSIQTDILNAYAAVTKTVGKIIADIEKNSSAPVNDATNALTKALTPEVRQKVKKAITSVVDSTLNALL